MPTAFEQVMTENRKKSRKGYVQNSSTGGATGESYLAGNSGAPGRYASNQALGARRVGAGIQSTGLTTGGTFGSPLMMGPGPQTRQPPRRSPTIASRPMIGGKLATPEAFATAWKERNNPGSRTFSTVQFARGNSAYAPDPFAAEPTGAGVSSPTIQPAPTATSAVPVQTAPPIPSTANNAMQRPLTTDQLAKRQAFSDQLASRKANAAQRGEDKGLDRKNRIGMRRGGISAGRGDGDGADALEAYVTQVAMNSNDPEVAAKAGRMATDLRLGRAASKNSREEIAGRQGVANTVAAANKYSADQERIAKELDAAGRQEEAQQVREAADRRHAEVLGGQALEREEGRQRYGLTSQQMRDASAQNQRQFVSEQEQRANQFGITQQQQLAESTKGTEQHEERQIAIQQQLEELRRQNKDIPEEDKITKIAQDLVAAKPGTTLRQAIEEVKQARQSARGTDTSPPTISPATPERTKIVDDSISSILNRVDLNPSSAIAELNKYGITHDEIRQWQSRQDTGISDLFNAATGLGHVGRAYRTLVPSAGIYERNRRAMQRQPLQAS